jgi:hypothetical protein
MFGPESALVEADHVAGRVAERAVARAARLGDGFLEDLRAAAPGAPGPQAPQ